MCECAKRGRVEKDAPAEKKSNNLPEISAAAAAAAKRALADQPGLLWRGISTNFMNDPEKDAGLEEMEKFF